MRQTDTAFMTAETWTEWLIPISQFAGVDMTSVMKITVGIGGQGNPSGAKGLLFIDDIQVVLEPFGLVAHYQMDGDVQDSSGNGFHGTLAGDPNFPVAYVNGPAGLGKGLLFDGAIGHQYIDLGPINPSAATGKLSVAMWAKWDGLSDAWQGLIGKRQSGWSANEMMWQLEANQTNGSLHFQREGANDLQLTTGLTVGQWTHLAVTFDGTTLTGYVDGAQVAQTTFSFGFATAAPVQIGSSSSGGGNAFNGTLDEVRIYDKALSADEVKTLAGK
jgi:arabinan endo-1,5-alpha-L-arabinosidase